MAWKIRETSVNEVYVGTMAEGNTRSTNSTLKSAITDGAVIVRQYVQRDHVAT